MKSATYRYPLRLDRGDKKSVDAVVRASGRTINQVLVLSVRKGLPLPEKPSAARLGASPTLSQCPTRFGDGFIPGRTRWTNAPVVILKRFRAKPSRNEFLGYFRL